MTDLPKYSWDQAAILGLATARGFQGVGIKAATVRKWASRFDLKAVGKAPGGAHLYDFADVVSIANTPRERIAAPPDNR